MILDFSFEAGSLTGSGAQGFSWAGWSVSCGDRRRKHMDSITFLTKVIESNT